MSKELRIVARPILLDWYTIPVIVPAHPTRDDRPLKRSALPSSRSGARPVHPGFLEWSFGRRVLARGQGQRSMGSSRSIRARTAGAATDLVSFPRSPQRLGRGLANPLRDSNLRRYCPCERPREPGLQGGFPVRGDPSVRTQCRWRGISLGEISTHVACEHQVPRIVLA